jgi:hypothetical protein
VSYEPAYASIEDALEHYTVVRTRIPGVDHRDPPLFRTLIESIGSRSSQKHVGEGATEAEADRKALRNLNDYQDHLDGAWNARSARHPAYQR